MKKDAGEYIRALVALTINLRNQIRVQAELLEEYHGLVEMLLENEPEFESVLDRIGKKMREVNKN